MAYAPEYAQLPPPHLAFTPPWASPPGVGSAYSHPSSSSTKPKSRSKRPDPASDVSKRRCVSTACIACRKRKSKCDGNTPACAACLSVYGTECIYDPLSDHRRKGVYRQGIDGLKDRAGTLKTLVEAILNYAEAEVPELVHEIRSCESLDNLAQSIREKSKGLKEDRNRAPSPLDDGLSEYAPTFESKLSSDLGQLRLDAGSTRFFGGTSNLVYSEENAVAVSDHDSPDGELPMPQANPFTSWTTVTADTDLIIHLLHLYFTWHYPFFVVLSRSAFYGHFKIGKPPVGSRRRVDYCTPLLVNAMLALGCHFTTTPGAYENPLDSATAGDHFFREAKRLIAEEESYEHPSLATVQALGLMSVREAGCGREANGWTYSGIAFRMACDLGLNLDSGGIASMTSGPDEQEEDSRRMTFWGCFLFDKCWSNYLGRLPHFQSSLNITCPKFDVFPEEEAGDWSPFTDQGFHMEHSQPSRVRTVATHLMELCDISSDLLKYFYHPAEVRSPPSKPTEIKRLSEIHSRLERWKRELPSELDAKDGALPSVFVMHMFFHLLFIHLFRPFLKYDPRTSPLPSNVSPRRQCTHGAANISKILRLYKRSYGLRQICNIVVYIVHSACTIHLLNLPDKNARRDFIHGFKHLEEIAGSWLCARRTLSVLHLQARNWNIELPEEAAEVFKRAEQLYGGFTSSLETSPRSSKVHTPGSTTNAHDEPQSSPQGQNSGLNFAATGQNADYGPDREEYGARKQHAQHSSNSQQPMPGLASSTNGPAYQQSSHINHTYNEAFNCVDSCLSSPASTGFPSYEQTTPFNWSVSTEQMPRPTDGNGHGLQASLPPMDTTHYMAYAQAPAAMQPPPVPHAGRANSRTASAMNTPQNHNLGEQAKPGQTPHARQSRVSSENLPQHSSVRRPSATDPMFGGVQALLSESQDFWLQDQSKIATGFGNWSGGSGHSVPNTASTDSDMHGVRKSWHE